MQDVDSERPDCKSELSVTALDLPLKDTWMLLPAGQAFAEQPAGFVDSTL